MFAHPMSMSTSQHKTRLQSMVFAKLLFLYPPALLILSLYLYPVQQVSVQHSFLKCLPLLADLSVEVFLSKQ